MAAQRRETRTYSAGGIEFEYQAITSVQAKHIRVRVGPSGVEVMHPASRPAEDVEEFLAEHFAWVVAQLDRVAKLPSVRLKKQQDAGAILLAGERTAILVTLDPMWRGPNRITSSPGLVEILTGPSAIPPERSLEYWLRREARARIEPLVNEIAQRLGRQPRRIYVRNQRTRWGSCSALGNLSFNWRLVMAPPHVLGYLVSHEVVHLVVPDHSQKFWLTLQGICPQAERARQWLAANEGRLHVELSDSIARTDSRLIA
ncbi:MAG: M48 family metallopeptidase [Gaiellaceae bacterium]